MSDRVSVLHAAKFYPPVRGGMERMLCDICEGTADQWDVRVVSANTASGTVRERVGSVDVVRAGALATRHSVPLCPSMPWQLWKQRADCVVLHEPNPLAGSALAIHTPAPRLIVWHHSDLLRPWWAPHTYGRVQRALYARADCVVVSSPALRAASELVRRARRVAVIPFGIDLKRFRCEDPARTARVAELRARTPGLRVLFVGRLVYYKGVEILLEAMRECPGTLVILGEGPLEPALRERVERHPELRARVEFVGHVTEEDLPSYYQASDLFVLPSIAKTEAFGIVQIEAMAAGKPVVSTDLPTGVPWVNQDGVTGLVVPPRDARALAQAIRRILEDAALRQRLGEQASRRADLMFSRERMVAAFKALVTTAVRSPERLTDGLVEPGIA